MTEEAGNSADDIDIPPIVVGGAATEPPKPNVIKRIQRAARDLFGSGDDATPTVILTEDNKCGDDSPISPDADIATTNRPPQPEDLDTIAAYMALVRKGIF